MVITIHIHAFGKAGCVHGSIVSPIMFPPIEATDRGDLIASARATCVGVCVSVQIDALFTRSPLIHV